MTLKKFREIAKNKTYDEFIKYLEEQPEFKIIKLFHELDKKELYRLARAK